ncbi:MAG: flagellar basal-body MS-ring/collar protein FliF [Deltaproteobacteria bacterium]|jgi:flagellar M-ring protein FliF|nr:flagellar basal-body MS-ring/collar protein FliF [Deltaproteobacteria bacterium]
MATPTEMLEQLKNLGASLTLSQKIMAAVVAGAVLLGFGIFYVMANQVTYKPLYTDLRPEDASEIVNWLKKENVKYELAAGGSTIRVPEDRLYDIRLSLAGAGLPKQNGVGFEVFDQTNMGVTDFVQNVQYQRAVQGELERTISRFPQIKSVRVHLAQPKDSLFVSERKDPTASVVLQLNKGEELSPAQVKGIVHLVSSAIPKLKKENVAVVDTSGNILYDPAEMEKGKGDDPAGLTNAQLVYQKRLEEYYKNKIQTMLEDALGPNKAVARVSTDVDFDSVQINEDKFDPDAVAVRSEQKMSETDVQQDSGGVPGVKGGLADKLQGNANQQNPSVLKQKKQDTTNYEITRTQRQINTALGKLKRISVGVMVDGVYQQKDKETVYVPRTPEEVASLEKIVKAAIGYSMERGDEVRVVNVPFHAQAAAPSTVAQMADMGTKALKPIANLILAVLFIFFVIRPLLNRYVLKPQEKEMLQQRMALEEEEMLEGAAGAIAGKKEAIALEVGPNATEELREMASQYPDRAAALIKIWLREPLVAEEKSNA